MNKPIAIRGIEYAIPPLTLSNDDMAKIVDTSDEWISTRTGIKTRHVVSGNEDAVTLANEAVLKLMASTKVNPETIDMIISATSAPQRCYPSVACEVQATINAEKASACDLVAACSGFIYALQMACANINSGFAKRVLIVNADTTTKFVDWADRSSCVLFGDGASAVLIEESPDNENDVIITNLATDGKYKEYIYLNVPTQNCPLAEQPAPPNNYFLNMAGKDVYKYVMKKIPALIQKTLDDAGMTINDIDYFVSHQANLRMIEALASRINIPEEKVLHNIEKYGNISAASIPCVIKEKIEENVLKMPATLLLSAFGAGMTSASAIIKLRKREFND